MLTSNECLVGTYRIEERLKQIYWVSRQIFGGTDQAIGNDFHVTLQVAWFSSAVSAEILELLRTKMRALGVFAAE